MRLVELKNHDPVQERSPFLAPEVSEEDYRQLRFERERQLLRLLGEISVDTDKSCTCVVGTTFETAPSHSLLETGGGRYRETGAFEVHMTGISLWLCFPYRDPYFRIGTCKSLEQAVTIEGVNPRDMGRLLRKRMKEFIATNATHMRSVERNLKAASREARQQAERSGNLAAMLEQAFRKL